MTIGVYAAVLQSLASEYKLTETNLISLDKNFDRIAESLTDIFNNKKQSVDPKILESKVHSFGSEQYVNEYKAPFLYIDSMINVFAVPDEVRYVINKNGRITYMGSKRNIPKKW